MQKDSSTSCASCAGDGIIDAASSGIGRRTFLAQSAILAAAAALAACGAGGGGDVTGPTLSGSSTIKVSDYPALANVGGVALVNISGNPFAVVRTDASTFVALSRKCPHAGSIVNSTASGFLCPNHGAQFSKTGQWVGGQRTSSLRSYPATYDATAGTVTIG
jgi:cytochrome b6-f complex iron-sulfur subunit